VFLITRFGEGELKGWQGDGFYVARNPGETEKKCTDRASQEAKALCGSSALDGVSHPFGTP